MTQLLIAAFSMGILGSFHCVGMCGPLALSLPLDHENNWKKFSGSFLYNFGRIITYSIFGLIFGTIGKSFALFGYQQWLSVTLGILIIIFVVMPKKYMRFSNNNFVLSFLGKLRSSLAKLFTQKNSTSLLTIGLLNGLLPCGLVYMAAAGAVATGGVLNSVLFMAFFGLGTLPMMWSVAFWGNYVNIGIRQKIRKAYPFMMVIIACLMIIRGMGLGINHLSPTINTENKATINCCTKPA